MTKQKKFIFYLGEKHKDLLFNLFGVKNITELRNKLEEPDLKLADLQNIELELKKATLRIKKADADFKEWKADYVKTFNREPTEAALEALRQRKKDQDQIKDIAENNNSVILNEKYHHFVTFHYIKNSKIVGVSCDLCRKKLADFESEFEAKQEAKRHVGALHMQKLLA